MGGRNARTGARELKDVENQTWLTTYRWPILVHASLRADNLTSEDVERRFGVQLPAELPLGGIVGMTEISPILDR